MAESAVRKTRGLPEVVPRKGRERGPAETKKRLVATAAHVFNDVGYFSTDSNAIAREAGYAPATFYRYFDDKRAIFLAAYDSWVADEWFSIDALDPEIAVKEITELVMKRHKQWAGFRASLAALSAIDPMVRKVRNRKRKEQLARFVGLLNNDGRRQVSRVEVASLLLAFERLCDAVAWGEVKQLGLTEKGIRDHLVARIHALQE
jgi:AcrR family transcriptional regulator